ncbi:MAG TPA: patatin-like phospholipase family protein [Frankiaceae bacterium]|nr:patatin-like phospholipase family protein [Frankiaceae bacterium]
MATTNGGSTMAGQHERNLAEIKTLVDFPYPEKPALEADLVMKGGITSGVVYPLAVCELAKTYRFRNVGGSSAGGIAAALAAAAEHARDRQGFQRLAALPLGLGNDLPELFQPSRGTRPLFELFRAVQDKRHALPSRLARLLRALLAGQRLAAAAAAAVVVVLGVWAVMLGAGAPHDLGDWGGIALRLLPLAPVVFVAAVLGAAAGTIREAFRQLPLNGHGLCIGSRGGEAGEGVAPFTDWMHDALQTVAATPGVLTFGDLWGGDPGDPSVRLEMMTTNVSQRLPMRLPFTNDKYMFCPRELARWFPPDVLAHLVGNGAEATTGDGPRCCPEHPTVALRKLPEAARFPVVMAVRMTLSFPGLISAVPLWTVDQADPDQPVARCWFSDGGISSNFPIHFFDTMLPSRPTFAISLGPYQAKYPDQFVHYRKASTAPQLPVRPAGTVGQFGGGILDTLQNWSDNGQSMLAGYRDRIVEVRQLPHEGGMNIDMDARTIAGLAVRGRDAAVALGAFDFVHHRRVRYDTVLAELQRTTAAMGRFYDRPLPSGDPSYRDFLHSDKPTGVARVDALLSFAGRVTPPTWPYERPRPDFTVGASKHPAELRIVAKY